jgi:hypothetical protein
MEGSGSVLVLCGAEGVICYCVSAAESLGASDLKELWLCQVFRLHPTPLRDFLHPWSYLCHNGCKDCLSAYGSCAICIIFRCVFLSLTFLNAIKHI